MKALIIITVGYLCAFTFTTVKAQDKVLASKTAAERFYTNKKYSEALSHYIELRNNDSTNMFYNYRLGKCYLNTNGLADKAVPYFEYVYAFAKEQYMPEILDDLGKANLHAHQFAQALHYFNEYGKEIYGDKDLRQKNEHQIEVCMNAGSLVSAPVDVEFTNLGNRINSKSIDFNPYVSDNELIMVFSSYNEYENSNVFYSFRTRSGSWSKATVIGKQVNTTYDEIVAGLSKDGQTIFVHYNEYSLIESIFSSRRRRTRFDALVSLEKVNTKVNKEEGICYSLNEDTMFFASTRPGGFGGLDIYRMIKLPNEEWSDAQNLGSTINSPYDDNYPNISNDGKTFYFASKGHISMGGYDLFKSTIDSTTGEWTTPVNLGYPVNDTYDNKTISMLPDKRYGYIAALKPDRLGDYDIYKVIFKDVDPDYQIRKGLILTGDSTIKSSIKKIKGDLFISVYNRETDQLHGIYPYNSKSGKYLLILAPGKYELRIEGDNYEPYSNEFIVIEKFNFDFIINEDIYLTPIEP